MTGLAIWALVKCSGDDQWMAYIYPDAADLTRHIETGPYKDLEACRRSARAALVTTNTPPGDYECGLNCKPKDGFNICEKTER